MLRKIVALILLTLCVTRVGVSAENEKCKLLPVKLGGKYGYINRAGQVIIPARFDYASGFVGGMARVQIGDVWTYVNATGEVMKVTFGKPFLFAETEYDFSEGLAVYRLGGEEKYDRARYRTYVSGGKYGYINKSGTPVIGAEYAAAEPFREGLAAVSDGTAYGYISKANRFVIKPTYQRAGGFSEGLAYVEEKSGPKGYVDRKGRWVIKLEAQITSAGPFQNGLARVEAGYKQGYINRKGEYVVKPEYTWLGNFSEGLVAFRIDAQNNRYKFGYLDSAGRVVIEPTFDSAKDFSEGLAAVQVGADFTPQMKVGYIDRAGKFVIEPRFRFAKDFSEALDFVQTNNPSASGYAGRTGKLVFSGIESVNAFCNGVAWVKLPGGFTGYVDKTGKVIWKQKQD